MAIDQCRCKGLRLNHLIFSDDVMIFAHGDKRSILYLVRVVKSFKLVPRLVANANKTAIFFGNVPDYEKQAIMELSGFVEGMTPFKYLGNSLNARYLKVSDFDALIDKMIAKITCWSSRNLSYAVRVMLLNYTLISFHSYWAQCMLLPKTVIHRINQLSRAFLWGESTTLSKSPLLLGVRCVPLSLWEAWVLEIVLS
ncbi:uncharacterized protein LOC110696723 [Chenopodium quinoa]|uniref:uncharacterized protein LOC110696723 n=1 Tax=Chenopodium quinoa TaxID=63459 RepID=UPI000B780072|nr:uncharacterized protein LOC110696723 [Chenopodium quinoa]